MSLSYLIICIRSAKYRVLILTGGSGFCYGVSGVGNGEDLGVNFCRGRRALGLPVIREELVDEAGGMSGQAGEYVLEIRPGFGMVALTGINQTINCSGPRGAVVTASEEPVLAAERHPAQGAFGGIVVNRQIPFVGVTIQGRPIVERIGNRLTERAFGQNLQILFFQPRFQAGQERVTCPRFSIQCDR